MNIPASDIALRPEFNVLFDHANISASHLATLDDLPLSPAALPPESTRWILVDHNKLQGTLGHLYSSRIHGVIDHHDEENAVPSKTDPEPRIVERSGSCTSLVVRYCRTNWDALSSSSLFSSVSNAQGDFLIDDASVSKVWDAQVAKLAIASILVDTGNLIPEGKVKDVDREAVSYLESKIEMSPRDAKTWARTKFYEEINQAKHDIDKLPLTDILRKDYKEWTEGSSKLGISSVVKPLNFLKDKAENEQSEADEKLAFVRATEDFAHARDLSIYAIITTSTSNNGNFRRELYLQSREDGVSATSSFEKDGTDELGLEVLSEFVPGNSSAEDGEYVWRKAWLQRDVSKSRKQVAPLLRKSMQAQSSL